jgi:hypothetical protein
MRRVLPILCCVTVLAGCGVQGGVHVEGRASQVSPPPSTTPLPSGTPPSADAIAVLRGDPQLDPKVKAELVPCSDGYYPIDDRYMDVTGDGDAELVVTLYSCRPQSPGAVDQRKMVEVGAGGWAAFVYNLTTKPPKRLLAVQDADVTILVAKEGAPGVYVIRSTWGPKDDPCCPTDQRFEQYEWDGTKFVEVLPR